LRASKVTLIIRNAKGKVVKTILVGTRAVNKAQTFRFSCNLPRGTYRMVLEAVDIAGNGQSSAGGNKLVVH